MNFRRVLEESLKLNDQIVMNYNNKLLAGRIRYDRNVIYVRKFVHFRLEKNSSSSHGRKMSNKSVLEMITSHGSIRKFFPFALRNKKKGKTRKCYALSKS